MDPPETNREKLAPSGYTFTFLSDPNAEVIKRYDLVHPSQGADGGDIARPAEFLLDTSGVVRWVNITENYLIRLRPEQVLEAAKSLP